MWCCECTGEIKKLNHMTLVVIAERIKNKKIKEEKTISYYFNIVWIVIF